MFEILKDTKFAVEDHEQAAKAHITQGDYNKAIEYLNRLDDLRANLLYFIAEDLPEENG